MPATYEPIASTTLGSNTGVVEFSSIPSTYTDLILVGLTGAASGTPSLRVRFNTDTGSNYSGTVLGGNGSSATSARDSSQTSGYGGSRLTEMSTAVENTITIHIQSYANTNVFKTWLYAAAGPAKNVERGVGLWRSTSAIDTVKLSLGGSFPTVDTLSGTTWSLYGIKAA